MHHLHSLLEDTVDVVEMHGTNHDTPIPSTLAPMPEAGAHADPSPTMRFRAGTVDQAIADATAEIGREVEVVEASRIRRGGLGGFFAHDLGVEIVVAAVSPLGPARRAQLLADSDTGADSDADHHASGSRPRQIDSESFASHFARRLALDPLDALDPHDIEPEPVEPEIIEPEFLERRVIESAPDDRHAAPAIAACCGEPVDEQRPTATSMLRPRRVSTSVRRVKRSSPTGSSVPAPWGEPMAPSATPAPAPDPAPAPAVAVAVAVAVPTDALGGALTGAVSALVERLAHTTPVEGSRLADLDRLHLKLTTSGGDVIELTAELRGG